MNDSFQYILRFTLAPGVEEDNRREALVRFCEKASLDEVMFFIRGEELSNGHTPLALVDTWLETIYKASRQLKDIGVGFSVNPWESILHSDGGGSLAPDQSFGRMVDRNGRKARQIACPSDADFRKYICEKFRRIASLSPRRVWIDDDCRLHNHRPLEWGGGCFCERHMKLYSERAGKPLTREEFVTAITALGEPHPLRKIWLESAREEINSLVRALTDTVYRESPETGMGLMVSYPEWHMAEGRDWKLYTDAATTPRHRPVVRIPYPAYSEMGVPDYGMEFAKVSLFDAALLPEGIDIFPEVENYPMTRFNKCDSFTRHQVEDSIVLRSAGVTLDIFSFTGNGVQETEHADRFLSDTKPFMSAAKALVADAGDVRGIKVMVSPEASASIHSTNPATLMGLYPVESKWAALFTMYGISFEYCTDKAVSGCTVAVSGQYFRNLGKDGTKHLLESNYCLIEADAVLTLADMGLLSLIGAENCNFLLPHIYDTKLLTEFDDEPSGLPVGEGTNPASYEEVSPGIILCGMKRCRFNTPHAMSFLKIDYAKNADVQVLSSVYTAAGECFAPAMTRVNGRTFILPYNSGSAWQRLTERCEAIQEEVKNKAPYTVNSPFLTLTWREQGNRATLLFNSNFIDDYSDVAIDTAGAKLKNAVLYSRECPEGRKIDLSYEGDKTVIHAKLSHMELTVITAEINGER